MFYIVKRGTPGDFKSINLVSRDKRYAEGFCAGLNHTGKKYWHFVEEFGGVPVGTKVRYWPDARDGAGIESSILSGATLISRSVLGQLVEGHKGYVPLTHIEIIGDTK